MWFIYLQPFRLWNRKLKMRKRFVLLQALAILIAVFQYGMTAAGQDEGITSSRIRFYPYLTARYIKNFGVPISKQNCMGLVQAYPNYTIQLLPCKVKFGAYTLHFSLQDTSWRFWCWWVAGNNWSSEACSCSCTSTTKVPENASMDGVLPNTYWDPIHL